MRPSVDNRYKFPLGHDEATGASLLRASQRGPRPQWPWSYVVWVGIPVLLVGAAFGIGAGASLVDFNIKMHPLNVFVIWTILLLSDIVIGTMVYCVESGLRRNFFNHYETFGTGRPGPDTASFGDALRRGGGRASMNSNATWLLPLTYLVSTTSSCFLIVLPAIEWPNKAYSYWIAALRGLLGGFGNGAMSGFQVASMVPRYPSEVAFLTMLMTALSTVVSCMVTVGIGEAIDVTRPGPLFESADA